jgi:hypothetical protein
MLAVCFQSSVKSQILPLSGVKYIFWSGFTSSEPAKSSHFPDYPNSPDFPWMSNTQGKCQRPPLVPPRSQHALSWFNTMPSLFQCKHAVLSGLMQESKKSSWRLWPCSSSLSGPPARRMLGIYPSVVVSVVAVVVVLRVVRVVVVVVVVYWWSC